MDNHNNFNEQMLQKKQQEVIHKQIEGNAYLEEQKTDYKLDNIQNQEIHENQVQKNNIQVLRDISKMTEEEKVELTNKAKNEFESSTQLQKERRLSGLKKSQRKEIAQSLEQKNKLKEKEVVKTTQKRNNAEEIIKGSFLEQEKWMLDKRGTIRVDVTGHERRMRASRNALINLATKKSMKADIDNLVYNLRYDMYLEQVYEPDVRLKDHYQVSIQFKHLLDARDRLLGRQLTCLGLKNENPNYKWPDDLPEPEVSKEELKKMSYEFGEYALMLKCASQNAGANHESLYATLRAMKKARVQLLEDNEFKPSAYTRDMIRELDKQIVDKEKELDQSNRDIRYPAGIGKIPEGADAEQRAYARAKAKHIDDTTKELAVKAYEITKMKKGLEGLQGEELKTETEKVDAAIEKIEKDVNDILEKFRFK